MIRLQCRVFVGTKYSSKKTLSEEWRELRSCVWKPQAPTDDNAMKNRTRPVYLNPTWRFTVCLAACRIPSSFASVTVARAHKLKLEMAGLKGEQSPALALPPEICSRMTVLGRNSVSTALTNVPLRPWGSKTISPRSLHWALAGRQAIHPSALSGNRLNICSFLSPSYPTHAN